MFLLGDNIVVVALLLQEFWNSPIFGFLHSGGDPSPSQIAETSLLALAAGIAFATTISIKTAAGDPSKNYTLIAGAAVGTVAGLLEILKLVILENAFGQEATRPFFFFGVFVLLYLTPVFLALSGDRDSKRAKSRLWTLSVATLIGLFGAILLDALVRLMVLFTPFFAFDGDFTATGDLFFFRPIAFVWLGVVWSVAAFLKHGEQTNPEGRTVWMVTYLLLAVLCGAWYAAFEISPDDSRLQDLHLPSWVAFALVAASPVIAGIGSGAAQNGWMRTSTWKASLLGGGTAFFAGWVGVAQVFGLSFSTQTAGALLYGVCGAGIAAAAIVTTKLASHYDPKNGTLPDPDELSK